MSTLWYSQGQDLQFLVGIDGQAGRPMFEDVQGVTVTVKRPLRDLFKRLPEVETDVQVTPTAASLLAKSRRQSEAPRPDGADNADEVLLRGGSAGL